MVGINLIYSSNPSSRWGTYVCESVCSCVTEKKMFSYFFQVWRYKDFNFNATFAGTVVHVLCVFGIVSALIRVLIPNHGRSKKRNSKGKRAK